MTGYTVHSGPSGKFSEGWQRVFGQTGSKKKQQPAEAKSQDKKKKPRKTSK
ncbi:MAG: hypothetical protein KDA58_08660 [Planctomycetaceae bacterium]|nr:hypothetical protein [Planctomycetaceae bacterium]